MKSERKRFAETRGQMEREIRILSERIQRQRDVEDDGRALKIERDDMIRKIKDMEMNQEQNVRSIRNTTERSMIEKDYELKKTIE
jgi:hypothetical protein